MVGACVGGGMCGGCMHDGGHGWSRGCMMRGMHSREACVVGVCMAGGHAWQVGHAWWGHEWWWGHA